MLLQRCSILVKKSLSLIILANAVVFTLSAQTKTAEAAPNVSAEATAKEPSRVTSFEHPIIARGDFDYPPFEFINEAGEPDGFNVELLEAIAEQMGIDIIIDLGTWSLVIEELLTGEIDLITGMYRTVERERYYDFSSPHNVVSHSIYTRGDMTIQLPSDLSGKRVLVQDGDVMHEYLQERVPDAIIVKVPTYRIALTRLSKEKDIDAALLSRIQARRLINEEGLKNLYHVGLPIYPRKYCFAVKKGNSDLLAVLNDGLVIVRENGTYDRLYTKWFGQVARSAFAYYFWKVLVFLIAPLIVITGLVLFWIMTLKQQVKQRTEELQNELLERREAEWRFRNVFEGVPVSIWEEDFSEVRDRIEKLREDGVQDFKAYLEEHPDIIEWMVEHIKIININPATLDLYKAESKEQLLGSFSKVETAHIRPMLEREFLAIVEGEQYLQDETKTVIFTGEEKIFLTTVHIPSPGSQGFHHMLVSMVDITDQKKAEQELAASLSEKDVLLKELHHRVKNNMQLMSSLINLQSSSIDDEEILKVIRSSENRIRSMALVHELLYQSEGLAAIDLGYYLQNLVLSIMESHQEYIGRRITLEHSVDEIPVSIDTAIPCGLIVNELISNAMEHAFSDNKEKGKVSLEVKIAGEEIAISIRDNGAGMEQSSGQFPGVMKENRNSMGLTLVEALASQLQGELSCNSTPGKGTLWQLHMKNRHK